MENSILFEHYDEQLKQHEIILILILFERKIINITSFFNFSHIFIEMTCREFFKS